MDFVAAAAVEHRDIPSSGKLKLRCLRELEDHKPALQS